MVHSLEGHNSRAPGGPDESIMLVAGVQAPEPPSVAFPRTLAMSWIGNVATGAQTGAHL